MAQQRKKVLLKREQDKSFGFLKIETSIKPESRMSKYKEYLVAEFWLNVAFLSIAIRDAEDDQVEHFGKCFWPVQQVEPVVLNGPNLLQSLE